MNNQILNSTNLQGIEDVDRAIILATQAGLPLVSRPYEAIAKQLKITEKEVIARVNQMKNDGVIRRIALVPNHYSLGYLANGMSVWDVPDELTDQVGAHLGGLKFVSHCYGRPRHLPNWPYNIFAMFHGKSREEVNSMVANAALFLGDRVRKHEILYSTRILKKTGLRLLSNKPMQ